MNKERLILFAGSFDPFQNGHLRLVNYFENDQVHLLALYNPNKKDYLLNLEERIQSIRKVKFKFIVNVLDFHFKNPDYYLYMCNVVPEIEKMYPDKEICLLMGDDAYLDIKKWKDFNSIQSKIKCIVFNRIYNNIEDIPIFDDIKTELVYLDNSENVSSTMIKELLRLNKKNEVSELVPSAIKDYLITKK